MTLGPIAFLSPALLAGLLALPLIWWLLRAVPPRPQRIAFPPTRILVGIESREKTPAKTPWWLTLIRMLAAALVILALADPVLNPNRETALAGSGPVVLVVDNGWASATHWQSRTFMLERLIAEAEAQSRPVMV
ncbi:MAG TPA: BatA domain-containing protein, partial [Hyphomicrobiaceae bacterium]|nr:BatA domain-containing protein [Hyphomicrobiaceae bacterium]